MTDEKNEQRRPAGKQRPGEAEQRQAQEERDSREGGGEVARKEQDKDQRDAEKHGRETRQGKHREDMTEAERQHEAEQAFRDAPPGYSPTARIGD